MTTAEEEYGFTINGVIPGSGRCVVEGCRRRIETGPLMCMQHWRRVPFSTQARLAARWADWCNGDAALADIREAQWLCLEALR